MTNKNQFIKSWPKEDNGDIILKIILFVLSPFLGFIYSLRKMNSKSSYVIFFLTAVIFGLSFSVPSGKVSDNMLDGASYREKFEYYQYINISEYIDGLKEYLTFEEGAKDYYFDTVAFYISRITDNYHVMFMVFAIIFAFFSLRSFRFLTNEDNFNTSLACFILAYLFMFNHIFNINGVRFWTAAWVAVYSILQIFIRGNKRFFILAAFTPFFHAAYWIFLIILVVGYLFKKSHRVWVILFFASFIFSIISVDLIRGLTGNLPPFLAQMVEWYTDPEYIEQRSATGTGFSWLAEIFSFLVKLYINVMVFLFIKNSRQISSNSKSANLYSFLLVWMTLVNFTIPIPSVGGRFIILAYPLIAHIWLVNFGNKKYKHILYALPIVFSFNLLYQVRYYKMVLEMDFFFTSPFYLIYKYLIA